MKITLLSIALIIGFASAALARPDQQTPTWEECNYSDTDSCG
jgi:hypothetical protein